ncbi:hypothetical protein Y032_0120g903 [Ancylostoma ceylanicum]|nr:hypothetical protein Y032_0120g903 [Ancylostoma ceylanicum]
MKNTALLIKGFIPYKKDGGAHHRCRNIMAAINVSFPAVILVLSVGMVLSAPPAIGGDIQRLPDCKDLGDTALKSNIRTRVATEVVVAKKEDMKYDCNLEGFASLFLTNRRLFEVYTANVLIVQTEFEEKKADNDKVRNFIRKAVESWKPFYDEMGPKSTFGCNYQLKGNKHKIACLYM